MESNDKGGGGSQSPSRQFKILTIFSCHARHKLAIMERPDLAGILSFEPRPSASSQSSSGLHDLTEAPLSANVTEVIDKKNLTIFGVWPRWKRWKDVHIWDHFFWLFFFVSIYPNDWWLYPIRILKENQDTFLQKVTLTNTVWTVNYVCTYPLIVTLYVSHKIKII